MLSARDTPIPPIMSSQNCLLGLHMNIDLRILLIQLEEKLSLVFCKFDKANWPNFDKTKVQICFIRMKEIHVTAGRIHC